MVWIVKESLLFEEGRIKLAVKTTQIAGKHKFQFASRSYGMIG